MKNILLALAIFPFITLHAQYYYNDIIGTQETNRLMLVYRTNKVNTARATGFDGQGVKATNFSEFHEVKDAGKGLKSTAINDLVKSATYYRFDDQGRLVSMTDSTSESQSITSYKYDVAGRIAEVQNLIKSPINNGPSDFNQEEMHFWIYNDAGKAEKMWRLIRSGNSQQLDSLEIRFVTDENGNISEERTFKKGIETGYLYYYYDEKNRLSDIVRYNTKLKKLLPDVMFEYDEKDRVVQKITTVSNLNMGGYLIWRYIFDEAGLKTKEALFNKEKKLTGRIDYSYTYFN